MVPVPENAVIENGYAIFVHEYQGIKYLNIKKIYKDKKSESDAIGKGLTIDMGKAPDVVTAARSFLAAGE